MNRRPRRPYEKKQASKGGALIFGLGLGALLATVAIVVALAIPSLSRRFDNLSFYARTYYRKLMPHPEFLPTPAPVVSIPGASGKNSDRALIINIPAIDQPVTEVITETAETSAASNVSPIPAALNSQEDTIQKPIAVPEIILPTPGSQVQLSGIAHQWQTWNNCGPATVTMNTSYFGHPETQVEAAQYLKPNREDKNVNPHELAAYARTLGMKAIVRQGGSLEQMKQYLSHNIPIIAETWLVHDGDGLGHYRLLTGYNDETGQFNTDDSLNGANFKVDYAKFDTDWRVFNRMYVVVYPPEQADIVATIIGKDIDDTTMYKKLVRQAQEEIDANPNDAIAYFNLGDSLTRLGRYSDAVAAFDHARTLGLHWRRLWYQFTPFEAYYAVGRYQDVLDLTKATIDGTNGLEEAYYYEGLALYALSQDGPEEAFEAAIAQNPNFTPAINALNTLRGE